MKLLNRLLIALCLASPLPLAAQSTAFTYQGRLTDNSAAANGNYDIRFTLHSAATGATTVGTPQTVNPVAASSGLFTVTLDFGLEWPGSDRWLELAVRPSGSAAAYTILTPRQKITAAPYAMRAATLSGNISAAQVSGGTLSGALLPGNVALKDAATTFTQTINVNTASQSPLGVTSTNTGGTWLNLGNSSNTAATTWNLISTGSANGEGAGKLLIRDGDAGAVRFTIAPNGSVGIGTSAPAGALLDVEGSLRVNDNDLYLRSGTDNNHGLGWYGTGRLWGGQSIDGPVLYGWNGGVLGTAPGNIALRWDYLGNVRVGSDTASGTLDITTSGDKSLRITNDQFVPSITTVSRTADDAFAGFLRLRHVVEMWPKADGSAGAKLDVRDASGAATIILDGQSGEGTMKALNLTGGADVAEPIVMPEAVPAGAAVVIDPDRPGEVKMSATAYDTCVAGIVSGANGVKPGLSLRQEGVLEGGKNVALTGRVYALADAGTEPIRPGDLLVTSGIPGHVMKATDRERSHGAILGKAMTPLASGTGYVLVLVNLQ